jgi:hypothetical protein
MSKMNKPLDQDIVENLGVWQAATMDGYWDDKANKDIQYVYLLGRYQATLSMHNTYGNSGSLKRVKQLRELIKKAEEES